MLPIIICPFSVFLFQVVVAGHIHAVYTHLSQQMTTYKPGDTPIKRRGISSQNEVEINILHFLYGNSWGEMILRRAPVQRCSEDPRTHPRWRALLKAVNYCCEALHLRCLQRSLLRLCCH